MSGGGSTSTKTKIPDYIKSASQYGIQQAKTLQQTPYQAYTGQGVADQTADQTQAQAQIRSNQGAYQPYLANASGVLGQATQQFGQADLDRLMNPYLNQVGNTAANKINESYDIARERESDRAQAEGAYGGSRDQLMQNMENRDRANSLGDMWGNLYSQGYGNAVSQYNTERGMLAQAANQYSALGGAAQQYGLTDANALAASGLSQQQNQQQALNFQYQQWLDQQNDPYKKLNLYNQTVYGAPTGSTTQTNQSISPLNTALGIGTTLGGAYLGGPAMCWVAREVYGVDNPQWLRFREWMLTKAPVWLLRVYRKHGEKFAAFISNKPKLKRVIRFFMDRVA